MPEVNSPYCSRRFFAGYKIINYERSGFVFFYKAALRRKCGAYKCGSHGVSPGPARLPSPALSPSELPRASPYDVNLRPLA